VPKKPYPYHEEEVTFANTEAKIELAGTFTKPKDGGPHPAVVLISGSGPQDRDESLLGHQPFLVIADYLTRQGIAVLRYDDRGVGQSKGDHDAATSADFATDAYAAVKYLQSRADVDGKRIGLAGHSEGGVIAPMVAAGHPDDIAFIILMAGTGLPGDEILSDQLAAILKTKGLKERDIHLQLALQKKLISLTKAGGEPKELAKKLAAAAKEYMDALPEEDRKVLESIAGQTDDGTTKKGPDEKEKMADAEKAMKRLANPWMVYFLNYDPRPTLQKVKCPVLALNGEFDLQVTPKLNLPAIEQALRAGGNTQHKVVELKGLNHLFQHSKSGDPGEYGTIEETFAPEALKLMADWLNQTVGRR
jgi:pimeloyl-ACP methyl ester carboxylesterase